MLSCQLPPLRAEGSKNGSPPHSDKKPIICGALWIRNEILFVIHFIWCLRTRSFVENSSLSVSSNATVHTHNRTSLLYQISIFADNYFHISMFEERCIIRTGFLCAGLIWIIRYIFSSEEMRSACVSDLLLIGLSACFWPMATRMGGLYQNNS